MSLSDSLKKDGYILFTKNQFWGAFVAILATTGTSAWGVARAAIHFGAEAEAARVIVGLRKQAEEDAAWIHSLLAEGANLRVKSLTIVNDDGKEVGRFGTTSLTMGKTGHGHALLELCNAKGLLQWAASTDTQGVLSLALYAHSGGQSIAFIEDINGDFTLRKRDGGEMNVAWPR